MQLRTAGWAAAVGRPVGRADGREGVKFTGCVRRGESEPHSGR